MENVTGPCDDGDEVVGHRSQNDVFVTTGAMDPVKNESTSTPLGE